MGEENKLNHWDLFIAKLAPELHEAIMHNGPLQVRTHQPMLCPNEEVVFRIQYIHPKFGARREELVLFRDGTWRYIAT